MKSQGTSRSRSSSSCLASADICNSSSTPEVIAESFSDSALVSLQFSAHTMIVSKICFCCSTSEFRVVCRADCSTRSWVIWLMVFWRNSWMKPSSRERYSRWAAFCRLSIAGHEISGKIWGQPVDGWQSLCSQRLNRVAGMQTCSEGQDQITHANKNGLRKSATVRHECVIIFSPRMIGCWWWVNHLCPP